MGSAVKQTRQNVESDLLCTVKVQSHAVLCADVENYSPSPFIFTYVLNAYFGFHIWRCPKKEWHSSSYSVTQMRCLSHHEVRSRRGRLYPTSTTQWLTFLPVIYNFLSLSCEVQVSSGEKRAFSFSLLIMCKGLEGHSLLCPSFFWASWPETWFGGW